MEGGPAGVGGLPRPQAFPRRGVMEVCLPRGQTLTQIRLTLTQSGLARRRRPRGRCCEVSRSAAAAAKSAASSTSDSSICPAFLSPPPPLPPPPLPRVVAVPASPTHHINAINARRMARISQSQYITLNILDITVSTKQN